MVLLHYSHRVFFKLLLGDRVMRGKMPRLRDECGLFALPPQDVPELLVSGQHGAKCRVRTSVWFNAWTHDLLQLFGTDRVRGGNAAYE